MPGKESLDIEITEKHTEVIKKILELFKTHKFTAEDSLAVSGFMYDTVSEAFCETYGIKNLSIKGVTNG